MSKAPLSWLQAFEAAGRHGSFKAAAEELNVSPSNISHQVRKLENFLGAPLFSRSGRQIELTEEGQTFLPALTAGFQTIRSATPELTPASERLHIGAFPFVANEVVAPNVSDLKARLPRTELRLFTHTDLQALTHVSAEQRLDLVVRYGPANGRFPGLVARKLGDVAVVPVVGPSQQSVKNAEELLALPLIRVLGPFQGWELWQARFAPERSTTEYSLETDSFHAAMLAVERGEGACLAVLPYLSPWVRSGRVRAMPELTLPVPDQAAFAVFAPHQESNPAISAFIDWLKGYLA